MAGREERELLFVPVYFLSNMFSLPVGISQNKNPSSCGCQHNLQSQECCQCIQSPYCCHCTESRIMSVHRVQNVVTIQSSDWCPSTESILLSVYRYLIVVCVQRSTFCLINKDYPTVVSVQN